MVLVFALCVMLSAFNWNLCHVVSLGIKESDLCHSFVWRHSQQGISFLSGSMAGPVAVTFIIIFLPPELSFTSGMDAQGTQQSTTICSSGQVRCATPASITRPHDEQEAAPVINHCGVTGRGKKKLTSCLLSKHTKTGLSLKSLCRFKGALHLFLMWKSVYFPPVEHYCCVMSFVALMGAFRSLKKIAQMMSSGLFIYVRLNRVREDLTNETEDWVTFEADVFELDPQWAPGVRVSGSLPYWF